MKVLALETSTEACSVALRIDHETFERFEIAPRRHTDLLLQMVDQLLQAAPIKLSELDAIAVGKGPGSFMGVRLAAGVAQGLAFAAGLPVVAISSLQALAQRAYQKTAKNHIAAAWDARMGEIYWGLYQAAQGLMMPMQADRLSPPPAIVLPTDIAWSLVGNAWQTYQTELSPQLQEEPYLIHPSAAAVAELASYYYAKGEQIAPEQLAPSYLRQRVAFKSKVVEN